MRTGWSRYLVVGATVSIAVTLMPVGLVRTLLYAVVGTSGVVAVVVGVHRNLPTQRRTWHWIAAGNISWILGDAVSLWYSDVAARPLPSPCQLPFVVAYLLLVRGLLKLTPARGSARRLTSLLDASIVAGAVGLVSWVFLIQPSWALGGEAVLDRMIDVAYPIGDVVLFAVGMRLVTSHGRRTGATRLLAAALGALLVSDALMAVPEVVPGLGAWAPTFRGGWLLGFVLWGATALHPAVRVLACPAVKRDSSMLVGRLTVTSLAVLIGPAIIAGQLIVGTPLDVWPVVVGSTVLVFLVLLRMAGVIRELGDEAERFSRLANSDAVTGLANRRRYVEHLGELLAEPPPDATLLLVDLERFGQINDALGYGIGDALLRAVGRRLTALIGESGLVARVGADSFGVLDRAFRAGQGSDDGALHLRDALERPYELGDRTVSVEVGIGIVHLPDDGASPALAQHRAVVALCAAQVRPGRIARYSPALETGSAPAPALIDELRAALDQGDLVLHYQPQVEISTGRVLGVEALARWVHPDRGLLSPDVFVGAAEQTGLIGPLTRYVLDHALRQCAAWRLAGLDLTVAVNLSASNLLDPGLIGDVRAALDRYRLTSWSLELEITESRAMLDPQRSLDVLDGLAQLGVALSIDDYGTGHSSLAYLQRLPVRRLKIDQSLVSGVVGDAASAVIVRSTIELARHLRLDVVAEGVEDDETLLVLRDMRCQSAQGFGLGRPVPGSLLPDLVDSIEQRLPGLLGVGPAPARRAVGGTDESVWG
jgi:diguanylate cyclase (GGDEF)-like protein